MILLEGVRLSPGGGEEDLRARAAKLLRLRPADLRDLRVLRRSVDAREDAALTYTLAVLVENEAAVLRRCRGRKISRWEPGPGEDFIKMVHEKFPGALIIAEDLGYVTKEVKELLAGGANDYYSARYESAYCIYQPEEGRTVVAWYQNEAGMAAKLQLARMFGVKNVSVWRLGLIPSYQDQGLDFDVMAALR